jgi:splicing factor U2AF subunit
MGGMRMGMNGGGMGMGMGMGGGMGMGMGGGMNGPGMGSNMNVQRQRRRLYVGNITYDCNETNLAQLFNEKMRDIGFSSNDLGEPVVGVQVNHDKSYAFVEVRS